MRFQFLLLLLLTSYVLQGQDGGIAKIQQQIAQKQYARAEVFLENELKKHQKQDINNLLGEVYGYQGKWDYPNNAEYQFRYGGVLARKAQGASKLKALTLVGKMKTALNKAASLDKTHLSARWALVDLYISLPGIVGGSTSKAYDYAKEIKKLSAIDGHLALGYVYEYDKQPNKAKEHYMKALSYLSNLEEVNRNQLHYQIGKVCGDYSLNTEKGIYHMQQYIANFTELDGVPLAWAYFRMAKLYRNQKNKESALKWINKALALRSDFKQALLEKETINKI